ncbi:ABC transporter substrate-binding protein [Colwellia sp. E2M01]|nr:ABC transporter substrate-binding protein [Colwellia sp. E2M01]
MVQTSYLIKLIGKVYCIFTLLFIISAQSIENQKKIINVAMHGDGPIHRQRIEKLFEKFNNNNPRITIEPYFVNGMIRYSNYVDEWLKSDKGPEIIGWLGGSRVNEYASQGLIQDLTPFWQENKNVNNIPLSIFETTQIDNRIYSIPVAYALYGLYYRKSAIKKLKIKIPNTWSELLKTCNTLHDKQVVMFAIGTKSTEWILHGWLDYLILRLHGINFYRELASGQQSFLDERIRETLEHFKALIDNHCFNTDSAKYSIWDVYPTMIRGYSAMILSDGIPQNLNFSDYEDIGVAAFPQIKPEIPNFTVTPISVFVLPHYTELTQDIKDLLNYFTEQEFHEHYEGNIRHLPVMMTKSEPSSELVKTAIEIIKKSPGSIQYYDREVDIRFSSKTPQILVDFIETSNIEKTMQELESLRLNIFTNAPELDKENIEK